MNFLNFYTSNGKFPSSTLPRLICVWILRQHFFCSSSSRVYLSKPCCHVQPPYYTPILLSKASLNLPQFLSQVVILENWHLLEHPPKGSSSSFSYFNFFNLQWPLCSLWLCWSHLPFMLLTFVINSKCPTSSVANSFNCPAYLFSCLSTMILWPHHDVQSIHFPTSLLTSPVLFPHPIQITFYWLIFLNLFFIYVYLYLISCYFKWKDNCFGRILLFSIKLQIWIKQRWPHG